MDYKVLRIPVFTCEFGHCLWSVLTFCGKNNSLDSVKNVVEHFLMCFESGYNELVATLVNDSGCRDPWW